MRRLGSVLSLLMMAVIPVFAGPFVVFPQAGSLSSPDGRFQIRNAEREAPTAEFSGTFHSLWLFENASGRSRKLCDYLGVSAVSWSNSDFVIVTQYVGKKTSRALVFSLTHPGDTILLDSPTLTHILPPELRDTLRENDHVFVEGSRIEGETLYLTVWGYGRHDANGFRWHCQYALPEGTVACEQGKGR